MPEGALVREPATTAPAPRPGLEETLETTSCPTCRTAESTPYRRLSGYTFQRCAACGLVYMSPRPRGERLRGLYSEGYFESSDPAWGYAVYVSDRAAVRDKAERLLPAMERYGKKGRLLDVGCAYGFAMEVAKERGWSVHGVEPAEGVASAASLRLDVGVERDLFDARFGDQSFDGVVMWDVIEHLPDPRATLDEVRRILRPTGVCSIVTPDLGSLAARILGERWEEMRKMPEHIFFFDRRSLTALLEATGFTPLEWGTVGKHMSVEETLSRMIPTGPRFWGGALRCARIFGVHRFVGYFDPRWKLAVTVRPRAS